MKEITFIPIGIIHSPFKTIENIPIQNIGAKGERGTIETFPEFASGLTDLDGFSHLILLYHFHKVNHFSLQVKPFMDDTERGVFATRSPVRPNPIGLTVVKFIKRVDNLITIEDIDMLDQTPLIDIKPFLPTIDDAQKVQLGWLTGKINDFKTRKSDIRFAKKKIKN